LASRIIEDVASSSALAEAWSGLRPSIRHPFQELGFGLGIIEALACGLVVAVTPVGVAGELIQHGINGFLFRPDDSAAIAGAIDAAMAERADWPALRERARAEVVAVGPHQDLPVRAFHDVANPVTDRDGLGEHRALLFEMDPKYSLGVHGRDEEVIVPNWERIKVQAQQVRYTN
jgi:hypothetical protein